MTDGNCNFFGKQRHAVQIVAQRCKTSALKAATQRMSWPGRFLWSRDFTELRKKEIDGLRPERAT
jgi:hypothetical protein